MNAIELNHICKSFGEFAIRDLSLTVPSGTICGLVGENGAGKSTTIRLLMNALRPGFWGWMRPPRSSGP